MTDCFFETVMEDYKFYGKDILFNEGRPLSESTQTAFARAAFSIPRTDNIYFAVNANTFGAWSGFSEKCIGFAIATKGIYFRTSKKQSGYLTFEEFSNKEITKFLGYVRIGGFEFNVGFSQKICDMLWDIQREFQYCEER